jgi:hypothetical protein
MLKVLELFAGSRSVGRKAESLDYEVFSVDWHPYRDIDLLIDIENLKTTDIPFVPDIIWASPDCTTYSIAAISTHRNKEDGTAKTAYAEKCDRVNIHVLNLINEWLKINPSLIYYIENPRGYMRKMPWMQGIPIRHTVWYCQYGDTRAKPTDIWTNNASWVPRPECHNFRNGLKHCHHEPAPRGSKTGTQARRGSYDRSKIPGELCLEVLMSCNSIDIKTLEEIEEEGE